jgi:hypothetical protein
VGKVGNQFQAIVSGLRRSARLGLQRRPAADTENCPGAAIITDGPGRDALKTVFRDAGWRLTMPIHHGHLKISDDQVDRVLVGFENGYGLQPLLAASA